MRYRGPLIADPRDSASYAVHLDEDNVCFESGWRNATYLWMADRCRAKLAVDSDRWHRR